MKYGIYSWSASVLFLNFLYKYQSERIVRVKITTSIAEMISRYVGMLLVVPSLENPMLWSLFAMNMVIAAIRTWMISSKPNAIENPKMPIGWHYIIDQNTLARTFLSGSSLERPHTFASPSSPKDELRLLLRKDFISIY